MTDTTKLPKHKFWGAGEPDCPQELKAPNGELHTTRCKVCGDGWRKSSDVCLAALQQQPEPVAPRFPTMLRKMWSGGEVQAWIDEHWIAPPALQQQEVPREPVARMSDELRDFIEGMSVSVDVSTGEHDAQHRYFGTVTEVMDDRADKHGVTLLVQDAKPNFAAPSSTTQQQEPQWGPILDALDGWSNDSRDEDYTRLARLVRAEHARTLDRIDATQQQEAATWLLYEHEDGRHAVAPTAEAATFAHGNPAWHRMGPVEVHGGSER